MKFGELIKSLKSPTIDYNGLKDQILEGDDFVQVITDEITRVDRVYESLYNVYNHQISPLKASTDKKRLAHDIHQLYEYGVLNLVAIEKILKKHDKNNQDKKVAAQIQEYVKSETFLFPHLERSHLYKALPALYSATENDQFCNVCLSHVPYTIALDCKHVLCLNCSSSMSEHMFTQCPTCRAEVNLNPVYTKAKEILGATPNPTFSLLEGESIDAARTSKSQHQHAKETPDPTACIRSLRSLLPQMSMDPLAMIEASDVPACQSPCQSHQQLPSQPTVFVAAPQPPNVQMSFDGMFAPVSEPMQHVRPMDAVWQVPQFQMHYQQQPPQPQFQHAQHYPDVNLILNDVSMTTETRIASLFPRSVLRLNPADWKTYRQSVQGLSRQDEKVIQNLRRKELSCVYAERARQKRLHKLKDATGVIDSLQRKVSSLSEENTSLRQQLLDLQASVH